MLYSKSLIKEGLAGLISSPLEEGVRLKAREL